jgi:crotonobetaine/carnitine-CoA ligase
VTFKTIFEAFSASAQRLPGNPFFAVPARTGRNYLPDGGEFSFAEILEPARALAERYRSAGYGHGQRAALLLENRPEFFHHYLALNALGVSVVPINPDYRRDEMRYLVEHSEAHVGVAVPDRLADVAAAAEGLDLPLIDAENLPAAFPDPARRQFESDLPGRETEAALLYTSGTTGRPKGCRLSNHYMLTAGAWYISTGGLSQIRPDCERVLNPLPLFHMNALACTASGMILAGGCLITPDRFHPASWWQDVTDTGATVIHYLGVMPPILLNLEPEPAERRHSVRYGFGAGVDPVLHQPFEDRFGFPLVEGWGMTETGRFINDNIDPRQIGTRCFGRPRDGFEARVIDDSGAEAAVDEPGELCVRSAAADPREGFFSDYLKDPEATEESWRGGWFHTGDVVRQDVEDRLYFVDRKKNIIRRSGENIAAAEIEAVIQGLDAVAQVAVIAVADELREEEVMACIVAMPGQAVDEAAARAVFDQCHRSLAYFKAPGYVLFRDSLPTTGTQKVQKTELFAADVDPRRLDGCFDFRGLKKKSAA